MSHIIKNFVEISLYCYNKWAQKAKVLFGEAPLNNSDK